ncbi:MAG: threonine synthase [Candidatus Bathyarchaeia archaeon]
MTRVVGLRCRECGRRFPAALRSVCDSCWGPLEVEYDYNHISNLIDRDTITGRAPTMWRYFELLPIEDSTHTVDLGDGGTPLHHCQRLGKELGLKELYIKNDTMNPTSSFKDRPASVGVSKCLEFGITTVGCASTGNLAPAVAAHAAKAGLRCVVLVPHDIEASKIVQTSAYGAQVIRVKGTYDDANRLGILAAEHFGWGLANINVRSFYVEGSKTVAYETCEQLGWEPPDITIIPVASGGLLSATHRAFKELEELGWVDQRKTRLVGSQPRGCAPIVEAFRKGSEIEPVEEPKTIAKSLAIGSPASGYEALDAVKETGGSMDSPSDGETLEAIRLLGGVEGVFAEPAGAIPLATLMRLRDAGEVDASDRVVLFVTGSGFKAPETVLRVVEEPLVTEPTLDALRSVVQGG